MKLISGLIVTTAIAVKLATAAAITTPGVCTVKVPGDADPFNMDNWLKVWPVTGNGCDQTMANTFTLCDVTVYIPGKKGNTAGLNGGQDYIFGFVPLQASANAKTVAPAPLDAIKAATKNMAANAQPSFLIACGTNQVQTILDASQNVCNATASAVGAGHNLLQYAGCAKGDFYGNMVAAVNAGTLKVNTPGVAKSGRLCYTNYACAMQDQDNLDNSPGTLIFNADTKQLAQKTVANMKLFPAGTDFTVGSDDAVLANFFDKQLGCTPFNVPSAIDNLLIDTMGASNVFGIVNDVNVPQNKDRACPAPLCHNFLIGNPGGQCVAADETANSAAFNHLKVFSALSGTQAPATIEAAVSDTKLFCAKYLLYMSDLLADASFYVGGTAPMPVATNLATFLFQRFTMSYANLNCADPHVGIGIPSPIANFPAGAPGNNALVSGTTFVKATGGAGGVFGKFQDIASQCGIQSNKPISANGGGPTACAAAVVGLQQNLAIEINNFLVNSGNQALKNIKVNYVTGVEANGPALPVTVPGGILAVQPGKKG